MTLVEVIAAAKFWENPSGTTWNFAGTSAKPNPVSDALKEVIIGWITRLYSSHTGRQLLEGAAAAGVLNFGAATDW